MAWAESEALFGLAQVQEEANQKQNESEQMHEVSEMSQKALEAASEAVQLCRKAKDELLILHALQAFAKTLILNMQHEDAVPCIDEAMAMAQKMEHGLEIANLELLKAQICLCEGNEQEAKEKAQKAKELFLANNNQQGADQAQEIIDMQSQQQDDDVTGVYSNGPGGPLQAMPDMPNAQMHGGFRPGGMQRPPPNMGGGAPPPGPAAMSQAEQAPVASKMQGPNVEQIMEQVQDIASSLIGTDELAGDTPLMDAGLDSLASVEFQNTLQKDFRGISMPSTMMFDFPTTKEIANYIKENYK